MTKIVAFSDLHGQISKKLTDWFNDNPADILLLAGDIQGGVSDIGIGFTEWISKLPYTHKIIVFGNHDFNYEYFMDFGKKDKSIHFLNNQSITLEGIKFFGSPNCNMFGNWAFMKPEKELRKIFSEIPFDTNVIVTHTPVYSILDCTCTGFYAGSTSLLKRVGELPDLKYHICGHIHEGYGSFISNNPFGSKTRYLNVSILDEKYRYVHDPVVFDYIK